ncbi:hypothetical protein HSR122_1968 [Halapricum desulfuricans]|uniref:Uncharacterized protein n=1 Tax=Halapricum desulfuricans TaxID=2841257 RepID=A0A897NE96_9EURY|nr:hypothetical protein HSR122_1968 [Halapricum desulfuricans]
MFYSTTKLLNCHRYFRIISFVVGICRLRDFYRGNLSHFFMDFFEIGLSG